MRPPANECAERTVGARKRYNIVNALRNATRGAPNVTIPLGWTLQSRRVSVGSVHSFNRIAVEQRRLEPLPLPIPNDGVIEVFHARRLAELDVEGLSVFGNKHLELQHYASAPRRGFAKVWQYHHDGRGPADDGWGHGWTVHGALKCQRT